MTHFNHIVYDVISTLCFTLYANDELRLNEILHMLTYATLEFNIQGYDCGIETF